MIWIKTWSEMEDLAGDAYQMAYGGALRSGARIVEPHLSECAECRDSRSRRQFAVIIYCVMRSFGIILESRKYRRILLSAVTYDRLKVVQLILSYRTSGMLHDVFEGALAYNRLEIAKYCVSIGASRSRLTLRAAKYMAICDRAAASARARAARAAYLWWLPRCYGPARRSGRRMRARNFREYRRLCGDI